jgi:hypothetical protein
MTANPNGSVPPASADGPRGRLPWEKPAPADAPPAPATPPTGAAPQARPAGGQTASGEANTGTHYFQQVKGRVHRRLIERLNLSNLERVSREQVVEAIRKVVHDLISQEMVALNYFSHDSPVAGHRTPQQRATLAGFPGLVGENLFSMARPDVPPTPEIATQMVEQWLKSPDHRRNILDPDYNRTGVGVTRKQKTTVATQVFGNAAFTFAHVQIQQRPNGYRLSGQAMPLKADRYPHAG